MECPPTGLVFRRAHGASCACGVVRQPPTGFVPSSCVGEAVVALRQLISSRLDVKLLYPLHHQIFYPLFLCERRRKEKAIKRNALLEMR